MKENEISQGKHDRFIRVAERRVNDILEKIRILGNCSNRSSYDYSDDEANKIFNEIDKLLKMTRLKFLSGKKEKFKLSK